MSKSRSIESKGVSERADRLGLINPTTAQVL